MRLKRISALVTMVASLAAVSSARGDYTVWSCRGPDGSPVSTAAWRAAGVDGTRTDTCATGGSLEVTLPATTNARAGTGYAVAVPAGQTISAARLTLSAATGGGGFQAGAALGTPYFAPVLQGGCTDGAAPCSIDGEQSVTGPIDALGIVARCYGDTGCAADTGPRVTLTRSALDFADTTPPEVGPPADGSARVTDAGGGVQATALVLDGAVTQRETWCAEPFVVPQPCPAVTRASFAVPAGTHTIAVEATDAAGLVTRSAPQTVTVGGEVTLPARVALPARTVTGTAAPGTRVVLFQRAFGARAFRRWRTVTAGPDGRFAFPGGTESRQVRAGAAVADLVHALSARLAPHRGKARNGRPLVLQGRLTGAGGTRVPVTIQAIVRGQWQDIGHATARPDGTLVWRHRLTGSTQAATYRFRLRVPRTAGLPWRTVTSRAQPVRVTP